MWNIATPSGFGGAVRHTAAFIKPNRIVRDLSGLPAVLGRFGPFEIRLATTRRSARRSGCGSRFFTKKARRCLGNARR